ncbi:unnamed protein product [Chrysodeixis includens]|uniref:Uncharacterized protein n=1 Tax=Chrysodeixis includens TaxID=689277 RepID=A0A9N8KT52_CHRIL|nr:unnamed protein product [Chrysodeixis includens]
MDGPKVAIQFSRPEFPSLEQPPAAAVTRYHQVLYHLTSAFPYNPGSLHDLSSSPRPTSPAVTKSSTLIFFVVCPCISSPTASRRTQPSIYRTDQDLAQVGGPGEKRYP